MAGMRKYRSLPDGLANRKNRAKVTVSGRLILVSGLGSMFGRLIRERGMV
jgi:hypothetical protein